MAVSGGDRSYPLDQDIVLDATREVMADRDEMTDEASYVWTCSISPNPNLVECIRQGMHNVYVTQL